MTFGYAKLSCGSRQSHRAVNQDNRKGPVTIDPQTDRLKIDHRLRARELRLEIGLFRAEDLLCRLSTLGLWQAVAPCAVGRRANDLCQVIGQRMGRFDINPQPLVGAADRRKRDAVGMRNRAGDTGRPLWGA